MGTFGQMKDTKAMVQAGPGTEPQAQQDAAMTAQQGRAAPDPDFEPIAGVSLGQFAAVTKGVAAFNYAQGKLVEIAASHGISGYAWQDASRGWNELIRNNPAVALRFNQLYRES